MNNPIIDITGERHGRLLVLGLHHVENRRTYWKCECECGKTKVLRKDHFACPASKVKSCGCLHRENSSRRMTERHRQRRRNKED